MKVAKFGGSSLSNTEKIDQVRSIIENDKEIKLIAVSAPGKRNSEDTKVTDLLIALFTNHQAGLDTEPVIQAIIERYRDIVVGFDLDQNILATFEGQLKHFLTSNLDKNYLLDALKSCGEDFNAQLIAQYFNKCGIQSEYVSPKNAKILVTDDPGNAQILPSSYDSIRGLTATDTVKVIPGFFGFTEEGKICTFSRGGSDITGAILARGVGAGVYENYTDQPYIFTGHPDIVESPQPVFEITYHEMRELSYAGFGIFHAEALQPLLDVSIPVVVKSTSKPQEDGTKIVAERSAKSLETMPVVGVSGFSSFTMITLKTYMLNTKVGFLRRFLSVFEAHNISVEHMPTAIDYASVIINSKQFESEDQVKNIMEELETVFEPDELSIKTNLSSIAVVGAGIENDTLAAHHATGALSNNQIPIHTILQGASDISMFFFVDDENKYPSIKCIHSEFFE